MSKNRRLLRDFADLPGALILLFLSFVQLNYAGFTTTQEMRSRDEYTYQMILSLCERVRNLEVVADQSKRVDLNRNCTRYDNAMARDNDPFHLTWVEADEFFGYVQITLFGLGAILFLAGVLYRLTAHNQVS